MNEKIIRNAGIVFILLAAVISGIAAAQLSLTFESGFESQEEYDTNWVGLEQSGATSLSSEEAHSGSQSLKIDYTAGDTSPVFVESERGILSTDNFRVTFWFNYASFDDAMLHFAIIGDGQSLRAEQIGNDADYDLHGTFHSSNFNNGQVDTSGWAKLEIISDDDTISYQQNDEVIANFSHDGYEWDNPEETRLVLLSTVSSGNGFVVYIDDVTVEAVPPPEPGLLADIPTFMRPDSTHTYEATFVEDLNADNLNESDVTDDVTVTSDNESLITVNEGENQIQSLSNVSGTANISVQYEVGEETYYNNTSVFIAQPSFNNIGELPSNEWVGSFLGMNEERPDGTMPQYGLGTEVQYVYFAISLGAVIAWRQRNEYMGIGIITGMLILLWTLQKVSFGIMLVAVFYGIFAGYQQRETPSRSDTNVGSGLQDRF